jgi:hypothetical protein
MTMPGADPSGPREPVPGADPSGPREPVPGADPCGPREPVSGADSSQQDKWKTMPGADPSGHHRQCRKFPHSYLNTMGICNEWARGRSQQVNQQKNPARGRSQRASNTVHLILSTLSEALHVGLGLVPVGMISRSPCSWSFLANITDE